MIEDAPKVAVVGIVGRTNAGKSSLVNALVGEKVSIVSAVEQTTRNTVRGIVEDPRGQLVLVDTPGLHKAHGHLGKVLNSLARGASEGVDILAVVFDASVKPQMEDEGWMRRSLRALDLESCKLVFILNKRDKSPFHGDDFRALWGEIAKEQKASSPVWIEASAKAAGGTDALKDRLFDLAKPGERLFPEDIASDYPRKLAVADTIREKLLRRVYQEVPHELGVVVRDIAEAGQTWRVSADILVNRPSQKAIVVGKGAINIKTARRFAERELSDAFGVKVKIEMWVKVSPGWMKNPAILEQMGLAGALV